MQSHNNLILSAFIYQTRAGLAKVFSGTALYILLLGVQSTIIIVGGANRNFANFLRIYGSLRSIVHLVLELR